MDEMNEVISILREQLAKASALVDKLGAVDPDDLLGVGLVFCDLSELFTSLADASEQSARLCATAVVFIEADAE